MIVHVYVHPIDTDRFTTVPPGFRWCVSLSNDPGDDRAWLNAGWGPTRNEAELDGATVGVTVARGFSLIGEQSRHDVTHLDADPCTTDVLKIA